MNLKILIKVYSCNLEDLKHIEQYHSCKMRICLLSVLSCAFNVVRCFFRIRDRNRAEGIERRGAIGQSMSPEWSVVILKNMKKFVENCRRFR